MDIERERALLAARAEAEHLQRMAAVAAEIEATRRQLEEMSQTPKIEPPGRRLVQWGMPVAAAVLVAFVGVLTIGWGESLANSANLNSEVVVIEPAPVVDVEPEPVAPPPLLVADTPEPKPEPSLDPKPKRPKRPKNPKNENPLCLDLDGDPLSSGGKGTCSKTKGT